MFERSATIKKVVNGYIISTTFALSGEQRVFDTWKEAVDWLRRYFDEKAEEEKA